MNPLDQISGIQGRTWFMYCKCLLCLFFFRENLGICIHVATVNCEEICTLMMPYAHRDGRWLILESEAFLARLVVDI